jgi:hypothetical protein
MQGGVQKQKSVPKERNTSGGGVFRQMMKRVLIPCALCAFALLAWVAAPALSMRPYVQGAVDFESELPRAQPLSAAAAASSGGHGHEHARWITPPVGAEHRFDLVGVAGEMRPVEIRVRDSGGTWSEWVETHSGDPVYVGGADEAQVRAAFRPAGRLHFVNVSGTADGFAGRVLQDARESINSAFISAASSFVAGAAASKPKMVSRAAWGATQSQGGCEPRGPAEYGEVRSAVIHHTVNENTYTKAEAAGIVLGICRFHVNGNGWNDIGYQALVDRFGRLYKGRAGGMGAAVVGAQAQGFNSQTTAIASIGTNSTVKLNRKARSAASKYLAWKLSIHGAVPANGTVELTSAGGSASRYPAGKTITTGRIVGHRDLGLTECPGDKLWLQLNAIRKAVQKRIKG